MIIPGLPLAMPMPPLLPPIQEPLRKRLERRIRNLIRGLPGDRWDRSPQPSDAAPVVIGGCGRSGTTLVSAILDAHPRLRSGAAWQETHLFCAPGFNPRTLASRLRLPEPLVRDLVATSTAKGPFIDQLMSAWARKRGKQRWAEKSPGNVKAINRVFAWFPAARFIHVVRDGRDNVCSYRTHPAFKALRGKRVPSGIRRPIDECARHWVAYVEAGLAWRDDPRCMELRYEELVGHPEPTLRRLFEFIGEPWDPVVLDFHRGADHGNGTSSQINSAAIARWRRDLTREEARTVHQIAGPLLIRLGYVTDERWTSEAGQQER